MIKKEKLGIHKRYLIVNAPCPFRLISNFGTDTVERPSGIWQLDCYTLLPEKFQKNYPVFNLELEYDTEEVQPGFTFTYYFSDLNLGDSLKGVSGDLVELSSIQLDLILSSVEKLAKKKGEKLLEVESKKKDTFPSISLPDEFRYFTEDDKIRIEIKAYSGQSLENTFYYYLIPKSVLIVVTRDIVIDNYKLFFNYTKYPFSSGGVLLVPQSGESIQEKLLTIPLSADRINISFYKI